ncbi:MAG: hypothetical protein JRJ85_25195 [Deltaproteobacteria bacterium]|nr:hypothetical protein [Deltaproteobacteria bacterium]
MTYRRAVISLAEENDDDLPAEDLSRSVNKLTADLTDDLLSSAHRHLPQFIADGMDKAQGQEEGVEGEIVIGKRAVDRFIRSYVRNALNISIVPFKDQICRYAQSDADGNSCRYMIYGTLSSLHSSLRRLISDHIRTATRFGFARAARAMGYKTIQLGVEDGVRKTIEFTGSIMYRNLIPTLKEEDDLALGRKLIDDEESDV